MEKTEQNDKKPLVSVNICTYNRANLITKAIESVLSQDYPNIEIIVADGGSDETESVVAKFSEANSVRNSGQNSERDSGQNSNVEIKYFKSGVDGISNNRNFALSRSTGEYVAVLDSDDYWISPHKISQQVKFLEENPDHILVGTDTIIVDEKDQRIGEITNNHDDAKIRQNFLLKNQFTHSSVLFRKNIGAKYNEEIFIWEDYELFLTLARKNKVANLPTLMTAYKKHDNNVSNNDKVRGIKTLAQILNQNEKYYPNYSRAVFKNWGRFLRTLLPF